MDDTKVIRVRVSGIESPKDRASTKSSVTTTAVLESSSPFVISAYVDDDYKDHVNNVNYSKGEYFKGKDVTYSAGFWGIADEPKWVANVNTRFWCHHPKVVNGTRNISDPSAPSYDNLAFSYSMPSQNGTSDADNCDDILFAYSSKKYTSTSGPSVDITFHHALSMIRFCVSPDDGSFDTNLKIKNITISNIYSQGQCGFTGDGLGSGSFSWTSQSDKRTFGQNYNSIFSGATVPGWSKGSYTKEHVDYTLFTCDNAFFFVPQTTPSDAKITVTFVITNDDNAEVTRTVDFNGENWLADHYYTYHISAKSISSDKITFSVTINDWIEDPEYILE